MPARHTTVAVTFLYLCLLLVTLTTFTAHAATVPRPRFSWDTLPVFFHSRNDTGGVWSQAALQQLTRFPMVTSGVTGTRLPNGTRQSLEVAGPEICRLVNKVSNGSVHTFAYVNSVIDWTNNFALHEEMVQHPEWRLKHPNGSGWFQHNNWVYNLSNPDMRTRWIAECVGSVKAGCTGCFIDKSNSKEPFAGTSPEALAYSRAHLETLIELNEQLTALGKYAINNHLGDSGDDVHAMMIEDFAGSERCIKMLQTVSGRGIVVEAHAGDVPANYTCEHGGTNSLAAFLVGMGEHSYYHCQGPPDTWATHSTWPAVADESLDWLPQYDYKLGAPLGPATTRPSTTGKNASVWSRAFASGTRVEFDGGSGNGTVWWAGGVVQVGEPTSMDPTVVEKGCKWETESV